MRLLLAGMTLACIGQVAHANPYADPANAPAQAASSEPGSADPAGPTSPATPVADSASPPADMNALFDSTPAPTLASPPAAAPNAATPDPAAARSANPFSATVPAAELTPARNLPPASASAAMPPAASDPAQRSLLAGGPKPTKMMQELMKAPPQASLTGTPLTLGEAVRDSRSRQEQTQRARVYWDLAAAIADYYLAELESQELQTLHAGVSAPAQQWDSRLTESQTRVELARRAAHAAQLQLHTLLGGGATSLPLPTDVPHCGRYNAEYDEIFANHPNPVAKKLAEVLSLRHTELRGLTQAIDDAKAYRQQVSASRNPASDGSELLASQQLLSLQRRSFVSRAREYNQEIAAYTELAAPAEVESDRLVAMMIRTSTTADQMRWGQGGVQPAAAQEPASVADASAAADGGAKPTFAEGVREVHRPLQRLLGRERERSIVVRHLRNVLDRN